VDNFNIHDITAIPEDKILMGGVKDIGLVDNYNCLRVKITSPSQYISPPDQNNDHNPNSNNNNNNDDSQITYSTELWTLCVEDLVEKGKLINTLLSLKIDQQRKENIYLLYDQLPDSSSSSSDTKDKSGNSGNSDVQDGVLQLLQDWSECTLKCGGGKSYQQWMCIPPKNGGEPCEGDLIKTKDCNTQACPIPKPNEGKDSKSSTEKEYLKPIIKIGPYSNRPNRFTKCIIKEGDAFRLEHDKDTGEYNRIPSKILLNNRTFSIFDDDTYNKLTASFELEKTNFDAEGEFCVFSLTDNHKKIMLRGFDQGCGTPEEDKFVSSWSKAFNLFKFECKTGRTSVLINEEEEKEIKELTRKKTESIDMEQEQDKAEDAKETFLAILPCSVIAKKVSNTEKTGVKAVNKESLIEDMIVNEEKEREEQELQEINHQITTETKKAKDINNSIKEKELDDIFQETERTAEEEIKEVKNETFAKVGSKRDTLMKKIAMMRRLAQAKKNQMMTNLKKAKSTVANKVMKAMKEGNAQTCQDGNSDDNPGIREDYCNTAFPDDYFLNVDCKDLKNFCYTCCEKEFGVMFMTKRDNCYDQCDGVKKGNSPAQAPTPPQADTPKIQWLWKSKPQQQ